MPALPTASTEDVITWAPCRPFDAERIRRLSREAGLPAHATALDRVRAFRDVLRFQDLLWLVVRPQLLPAGVGRPWAGACSVASGSLAAQRRSKAALHAADPYPAIRRAVYRSYADGLDAGQIWRALVHLLERFEDGTGV